MPSLLLRRAGLAAALAAVASLPAAASAAEPRFGLLSTGTPRGAPAGAASAPCLLGAHPAGQPVLLLSLRQSRTWPSRTGAAGATTGGEPCALLEGAPAEAAWDALAVVGAGALPYKLAAPQAVRAEALGDLGELIARQGVVGEAATSWKGPLAPRRGGEVERRPAWALSFPALRGSPVFARLRIKALAAGGEAVVVSVEHGVPRTVFGPCATDPKAFELDGLPYVLVQTSRCGEGAPVKHVLLLDGGRLRPTFKGSEGGL